MPTPAPFRTAACAGLLSVLSGLLGAAEIVVDPAGDDRNPGTAEKPVATLEGARALARTAPGSRVTLRAGTYRLATTFALDARDSGTTYRAAPEAVVRLCGSIAVPPGLRRPVATAGVRERLVPAVRDQVVEIDLTALGIADPGAIGPRGFRRPYIPASVEPIIADQPLTLARWPNAGQPGDPMGPVIEKGSVTREGQKPERGGIFTYTSDRPSAWTQVQEAWITGLFANGYADSTVAIKAIDPVAKTIATVQPHMYGFVSGKPWNRWTALNLIEELDVPGEYVLSRAQGRLYVLPPAGTDPAHASWELSVLAEPLVALEGATGVVLDGLTLENSRGMGVYLERGSGNRIQHCTLRNLGMVGICIGQGISPDPDYQHQCTGTPIARALGSWHEHLYENTAFNRNAGTDQGIIACHLYNLGAGAISLGGGDRKTLTPAGNFVEDCDLHDFNRWDTTYRGAVNIDGVGNRVSHCRVHEAPALALYLHGNDQVIEYNQVYNAMLDGNDMGAIYMGRDPSEAGNIIRWNLIHHIGRGDAEHWRNGLYLDDQSCGTYVLGNVFAECVYNVALNGGYHRFENNVFMPTLRGKHRGVPPGKPSAEWYAWTRTKPIQKRLRESVDITAPPYSERYPELKALYEAPPESPRGSIVHRNLYVWPDDYPGDNPGNDNKDNYLSHVDPGFVDAQAMDFRLRPDSVVPARIPGWQDIPIRDIGPRSVPIGAAGSRAPAPAP